MTLATTPTVTETTPTTTPITQIPQVVFPDERFADPWAAATFLREQAIARGMKVAEADRIDQHCDCGSRAYAIPEYCEFLEIKPDDVHRHIEGY